MNFKLNQHLQQIYYQSFQGGNTEIETKLFVNNIRDYIYDGMLSDAKLFASKGQYLEAGIILQQAENIKEHYFGEW